MSGTYYGPEVVSLGFTRFVTTKGIIDAAAGEVTIFPKGNHPPIRIVGEHLALLVEFRPLIARLLLGAGTISYDQLCFYHHQTEEEITQGEELLSLCFKSLGGGRYHFGFANRPNLPPKSWTRRMVLDEDFVLQSLINSAERAFVGGPATHFGWFVSGIDALGRTLVVTPEHIRYVTDIETNTCLSLDRSNMVMWLNIVDKGLALAADEPGGFLYDEPVDQGLKANIYYNEDKKVHVECPEGESGLSSFSVDPSILEGLRSAIQVCWFSTLREADVYVCDEGDEDGDDWDPSDYEYLRARAKARALPIVNLSKSTIIIPVIDAAQRPLGTYLNDWRWL